MNTAPEAGATGSGRAALTPRDALTAYRPDIARLLGDRGLPAYRYLQVYEHLMRRPLEPFTQATALPADLRAALADLGDSTVEQVRLRDTDDGTTTLLLEAADGLRFESVLMRYRRRITLCVSSQVGCPLGCTFCVTGSIGFRRDLTTAEIVDQARTAMRLLAGQGARLSNVVFMGMGEPLLNLDAVLPALALLHDRQGLGLSQRALSVSTIGLPAGIRRLAREAPQVNLALSLHAPDDALRATIMPATRRHPLWEVFKATDDHFQLTHRKLFVEYLLLAGVNDATRHAHAVADLLRGRVVTVNLMPWNTGCGDYRPSSPETVRAFRDVLESRGIETSVRLSKGAGVQAACGQLAAGRQPVPRTAPSTAGRPAGWAKSRTRRSQKPGTGGRKTPRKGRPQG
jgi:23S rRNA (adenine2503-C2)-methyltransferase